MRERLVVRVALQAGPDNCGEVPMSSTTATVSRHIPPQRLIDLVNPLVRRALSSPLHAAVDDSLVLLHPRGRRSGRHYDIPVGYIALDDRLIVVTQHAWRANLRGGAEVDVTYRGRRKEMRAGVDEDPASVARTLQRLIDRLGWKVARRKLGLDVQGGRAPTLTELEIAARGFDLAVVTLERSPVRPTPATRSSTV
jgi:hypothetical protein